MRRSDKQRKAMFARLREKAEKHPRAVKAAILSGVVAGAGAALALHPKTSPRVKMYAGRAAAAAGAVGAGILTPGVRQFTNEQVERVKKRYGAEKLKATNIATTGWTAIRAAPVDIWAAKGVDRGASFAEGKLHGILAKRAENISKLAARKIGGVQSQVSLKAERIAGKAHRTLFPTPLSEAERKQREEWSKGAPDYAFLTGGTRTLRTEYQSKTFRDAAKQIVNEHVKQHKLHALLMGVADPTIMADTQNKFDIKTLEGQHALDLMAKAEVASRITLKNG